MKRIRCPKCDEPILFDDSQYAPGRTLIFECPGCRKQFRLRIKPVASESNSEEENEEKLPVLGMLVVIENAFHLKQEIPLYEGRNVVGRHVRGTNANAAFKTVDPSVDTTHCVFEARVNPQGEVKILLFDAPSNTGTYLGDHLLGVKEKCIVEDGDIVTIGATTLIVKTDLSEE